MKKEQGSVVTKKGQQRGRKKNYVGIILKCFVVQVTQAELIRMGFPPKLGTWDDNESWNTPQPCLLLVLKVQSKEVKLNVTPEIKSRCGRCVGKEDLERVKDAFKGKKAVSLERNCSVKFTHWKLDPITIRKILKAIGAPQLKKMLGRTAAAHIPGMRLKNCIVEEGV